MKKKVMVCAVMVVMIAALAVPAMAAGSTTPDINAIMGTAFESAVESILGSIGAILPIALPVMGISIAAGFAIKFFRRITAKA